MIFVGYTTLPYVIYIHMRLPLYARRSQDILARFSRTLPPDTELDVTTMHFSGRPRVNRVRVGELVEKRGKLGIANLARVSKQEQQQLSGRAAVGKEGRKVPWWWRVLRKRVLREFYVGPGHGASKDTGVWENVVACIRKAQFGRKKESGVTSRIG